MYIVLSWCTNVNIQVMQFNSSASQVTFSATISACEKGTQWQSALCLLQQWRSTGAGAVEKGRSEE